MDATLDRPQGNVQENGYVLVRKPTRNKSNRFPLSWWQLRQSPAGPGGSIVAFGGRSGI